MKTVSAKAAETDLDLTLEIYLHELQNFPGDVVRDALRRWAGKFFPAWAELREILLSDPRIKARTQRINALSAFLNGRQEQQPERIPPTQAQIDRNAAYAKRLSGLAETTFYDAEKLARLAAVDEAHGERAKAPGDKFKSIGTLQRENGLLEKFASDHGLKTPKGSAA